MPGLGCLKSVNKMLRTLPVQAPGNGSSGLCVQSLACDVWAKMPFIADGTMSIPCHEIKLIQTVVDCDLCKSCPHTY